jgi:hypothetical protein
MNAGNLRHSEVYRAPRLRLRICVRRFDSSRGAGGAGPHLTHQGSPITPLPDGGATKVPVEAIAEPDGAPCGAL